MGAEWYLVVLMCISLMHIFSCPYWQYISWNYPLNNNIPSARPWHMAFCSLFDYSRYLIKVKLEHFFYVWLILLSVMCSGLIIVFVCESSSSLRLYPSVCVCVCTLCLSLHLLRHIWVVSNIVCEWVSSDFLFSDLLHLFTSFENGFAGSYSNCLVLLKGLWHSDSTVLHSHRQYRIVFSFPTYWPGSISLCCVCWGGVLVCFVLVFVG